MNLENKRVAFLGDSITQGYGLKLYEMPYHQILARELRLSAAYNYGLFGSRIAKKKNPTMDLLFRDIYFQFRARLMPDELDVIFIFGGTNDHEHGDAPMGYINDHDDYTFYGAYNNLLGYLKNRYPKAEIIVMTPIDKLSKNNLSIDNHILKDYSDAIKEIAKANNVHLINLFDELSLSSNDSSCFVDKCHPSGKGHKIIAEFIKNKLE